MGGGGGGGGSSCVGVVMDGLNNDDDSNNVVGSLLELMLDFQSSASPSCMGGSGWETLCDDDEKKVVGFSDASYSTLTALLMGSLKATL